MEPPPYESISTKKVSDFWLKYVHNIYTKILFTDRADQTKKTTTQLTPRHFRHSCTGYQLLALRIHYVFQLPDRRGDYYKTVTASGLVGFELTVCEVNDSARYYRNSVEIVEHLCLLSNANI